MHAHTCVHVIISVLMCGCMRVCGMFSWDHQIQCVHALQLFTFKPVLMCTLFANSNYMLNFSFRNFHHYCYCYYSNISFLMDIHKSISKNLPDLTRVSTFVSSPLFMYIIYIYIHLNKYT